MGPSLAPHGEDDDSKPPIMSRFNDLMPPELHPRDKTTTDDTMDTSSSSDSSDSEDNSLAPPKLAPVNKASFSPLFSNDIKEEASIEYSSNNSDDEDIVDKKDDVIPLQIIKKDPNLELLKSRWLRKPKAVAKKSSKISQPRRMK